MHRGGGQVLSVPWFPHVLSPQGVHIELLVGGLSVSVGPFS